MQRCKVKLRYQGVSLGIQPPQILEKVGEQDSLEWYYVFVSLFFAGACQVIEHSDACCDGIWFQCDVSICSWFRRGKEAEAQKDMLFFFIEDWA